MPRTQGRGRRWSITSLWLPFDGSRYFLPNVTLVSAVCAIGRLAIARCFRWTHGAERKPARSQSTLEIRSIEPGTPSRAPS